MCQAAGLEKDIAVPAYAEPAQILEHPFDMLGPRPAGVDILDTQQEGAASLARIIMREQRGIGMAEVQRPGRARREASDHGAQEFGP